MVLQISTLHKLIHQQSLIILDAVSNQLYQIWMSNITKKINFGLQVCEDDSLQMKISHQVEQRSKHAIITS